MKAGGRMTATERLRAMLDDCGVPWKDYGYENHTWWGAWHAENRPSVNGLFLKVEGVVTPEQAIAATLGRGTCEVDGYDDGVDEGMDGDWYSYAPPTWYLSCGHRCEGSERPSFCPVCGKRVVEVDE